MPKKLLIWTVIAFAAFYLFTQPQNAASAVRGAAGGVGDAFGAIIQFISAVFA
ncbi:MAG TPA: hypothetical protein VGJ44_17365 [Kribbellaceae bacterium]